MSTGHRKLMLQVTDHVAVPRTGNSEALKQLRNKKREQNCALLFFVSFINCKCC